MLTGVEVALEDMTALDVCLWIVSSSHNQVDLSPRRGFGLQEMDVVCCIVMLPQIAEAKGG